jgi:hypothetical protein
MFNEFVIVIGDEVVAPVIKGYFLPAGTREIRRWKLAAWAWLAASVGLFCLASRLGHPVGIGLAIGVAAFAAVASAISSASASVLRRRMLDPHGSRHPPRETKKFSGQSK